MTFEQEIKKMLAERGMSAFQCDEIFARVVADEDNHAMRDHWQDDISGYPEVVMKILWKSTRQKALEYIEGIQLLFKQEAK